ncbi:MAG: NAD(P)/FAD-dependent oxidoreductase [Burkholderiaceae bacterium]
MPGNDDILVVGAGPAGLAVSACLRHEGLAHTVVERATDVASTWRKHYDRLHLHTVKKHSSLPLSPWPSTAQKYPARQQVVDYLQTYAKQHAITPRFGVDVNRIQKNGARFQVDTSDGVMQPKHVVIATGYNGVANVPELPGLSSFTGSTIHAGSYKNTAPYVGKRTLVVGCGNSGAEIALDLAEHGVDVAMVVRGPVHVIPRDLFGRPSQETGIMLSVLPVTVRDAIVTGILRLAVGDLSRWGILRPSVGPNRMIEDSGRVPILDIGTLKKIKDGSIRILPAVQEICQASVRFADGALHPFDAIIFATGYRPGLERVIEGFDAIADTRGRPHRFGEQTAIAGMYFVGFKNPPTGALREISIEAPRVAKAIRQSVS